MGRVWFALLITLALVGCAAGRGCSGAVPIPAANEFVGPPATAAGGLATLDWIIRLSFIGAAGCLVVSVIAAHVGIPGRLGGIFPRLAAALLATAIASLIVKVLVVKYLWLLVLIAGVSGLGVGALWVYGHCWLLEEWTGVDLNRNGTIGRRLGRVVKRAVKRAKR